MPRNGVRAQLPDPIAALVAVTVALATCIGSSPAEARLYQWRNPSTGSVELSGTPPAWYRGAARGPRVLVYENGLLFDDTAIAVEPALGDQLRESAFQEFERRQEQEALKRLERAARREQARRDEAERQAVSATTFEGGGTPGPGPVQAAVEDVPETLDPQLIDRLKSMLQDWDRQQPGQ